MKKGSQLAAFFALLMSIGDWAVLLLIFGTQQTARTLFTECLFF